jgi:hypothetical protein
MYELVTQISREYSDPIIEITESGCVYLMGPMKKKTAAYSTSHPVVPRSLAELARAIADGTRRATTASHQSLISSPQLPITAARPRPLG